ncbi:ANL family adenylate-forming protein [Nocardioides limicola]|uniref:ANL family adenylate-forming protein n=1 Tax=Nocardioides limicola TaxID=2803368 RepID=UPI00193B271F|nr:fatty acid--CoA ligase family protein [Nocardioides sp. DJM-14]
MIELIRRVAESAGDREAIVTGQVTTYAALLARSEAAAAALAGRGVTRFAIADHEAEVVLPLLAAASAIGAEACVLPPDPPAVLAELLGRFEQPVLVTDRADLADLEVTAYSSTELFGAPAAIGTETAPARPHLVLTTGTTGAPRGVRHDWARLLRGVRRVQPAPDERWLLAYGLHQFAGLQILLHVLAAGATLVAPAPRRPREGLAAMREHHVSHASATPTYWRFLLAELTSDGGAVPQLQQITLGGEAIPGPLLAQLRGTFTQARVSQVYAGSEFGSTGSTRDGRAGLPASVLNRPEDADVAFRIDDGELWIRSRTGMLGYYGEPPVDPDGWRATGDLVDLDGDRIVFRGRASDIINVGGVKVHPLPIEERVAAVSGVALARVYGRPNAMTGTIVAVEAVATPGADPDLVKNAIRDACADLPDAARPRSVRIVDEITTAGGKIVRRTDV